MFRVIQLAVSLITLHGHSKSRYDGDPSKSHLISSWVRENHNEAEVPEVNLSRHLVPVREYDRRSSHYCNQVKTPTPVLVVYCIPLGQTKCHPAHTMLAYLLLALVDAPMTCAIGQSPAVPSKIKTSSGITKTRRVFVVTVSAEASTKRVWGKWGEA